MNRALFLLITTIIASFILFGCSTSSVNPIETTGDADLQGTATGNYTTGNGTDLWGFYDVTLNLASNEAEIKSNRTVASTINAVALLNDNPGSLGMFVNEISSDSVSTEIDVTVSITHPGAASTMDAADVRGVLIGDGSRTMLTDPDIHIGQTGYDIVLENADGHTRWWNPNEFLDPGLYGYIDGKLGTSGYSGSATMNGYKYFGEGLGAVDDAFNHLTSGVASPYTFYAGTTNSRNYLLSVPGAPSVVNFQYAVIANTEYTGPGSRAIEAQAAKLYIEDMLEAFPGGEIGGDLIVELIIYNHPDPPYDIVLESSALYNNFISFEAAGYLPTMIAPDVWSYFLVLPGPLFMSTDYSDLTFRCEYWQHDFLGQIGVPVSAPATFISMMFSQGTVVIDGLNASFPANWFDSDMAGNLFVIIQYDQKTKKWRYAIHDGKGSVLKKGDWKSGPTPDTIEVDSANKTINFKNGGAIVDSVTFP
jgi:hypothetical protein